MLCIITSYTNEHASDFNQNFGKRESNKILERDMIRTSIHRGLVHFCFVRKSKQRTVQSSPQLRKQFGSSGIVSTSYENFLIRTTSGSGAYGLGKLVQPYEGPVPEDTADRDDVEVQEADEGPKRKRLKLHVVSDDNSKTRLPAVRCCENRVTCDALEHPNGTRSFRTTGDGKATTDGFAGQPIGCWRSRKRKIQRKKMPAMWKIMKEGSQQMTGRTNRTAGKSSHQLSIWMSPMKQILTNPRPDFKIRPNLSTLASRTGAKNPPPLFHPVRFQSQMNRGGGGSPIKMTIPPPLDRRRSRRHCIDDDGRMDIEMNPGPSGSEDT
ncbi:unnamed protein product [Nesidiocoris tenuis]|uniref:Uncharacterized protein n=1 Tax=Nesidiocoris tenuis TaxID=355587 RepID=A0A6H5G439_9HEMI|nr:unnamed protein product [Nesidiocoris tenuis]